MISLLKKQLAASVLALALAAPGYSWWSEGHQALALEATQELSPSARAHVVKILGSDNLESIAIWMDDLRQVAYHAGPLGQDPEALKFHAEFPKNQEWHYADMPLGTQVYKLDDPLANPDDVVHSIELAVAVLEGGGDPRITKLQALRMLVHFVGDEHQPLHVGNGFIATDASGKVSIVTDPEAAVGLPNDKGGNDLFFGPGKSDELHAYWDGTLIDKIAGSKDPAVIAALIEKDAAAKGDTWKDTGDYHHWPEAWATESLAAARIAYTGLVVGPATLNEKGKIKRIAITLPPHYDEVCGPVAEERLAKAGYHLAEILNAIQWSD
ncbi:MAG TPA: S1/P1 nuclease [Opitutaceae bacterium]